MISSDQRSPNLSSEILTGQPDRRFDFGFPGTLDRITITCELQVIIGGNRLHQGIGRCCSGPSHVTIRNAMLFSDLALSRRLERAEGHACAQFAEARRRLFPESGARWIECAGAYAVFDGIDSPVTQSFGLGIFEQLSPASLDVIERFFVDRGARAMHE